MIQLDEVEMLRAQVQKLAEAVANLQFELSRQQAIVHVLSEKVSENNKEHSGVDGDRAE